MLIVYVTYPSHEDAQRVSRAVIEARLAACANVFSAHQSLYWWDGAVQEDGEVAVIYKTTEAGFAALKDKIIALHPYDVPCIVAVPIEKGHQPFLDWVAGQI